MRRSIGFGKRTGPRGLPLHATYHMIHQVRWGGMNTGLLISPEADVRLLRRLKVSLRSTGPLLNDISGWAPSAFVYNIRKI